MKWAAANADRKRKRAASEKALAQSKRRGGLPLQPGATWDRWAACGNTLQSHRRGDVHYRQKSQCRALAHDGPCRCNCSCVLRRHSSRGGTTLAASADCADAGTRPVQGWLLAAPLVGKFIIIRKPHASQLRLTVPTKELLLLDPHCGRLRLRVELPNMHKSAAICTSVSPDAGGAHTVSDKATSVRPESRRTVQASGCWRSHA